MEIKQLKPTQKLIDQCKKEGIDPACLDHMLFEGRDGPTVMYAHFQHALGKMFFTENCKICETNRDKWLKLNIR